jgi:hypothetical protein
VGVLWRVIVPAHSEARHSDLGVVAAHNIRVFPRLIGLRRALNEEREKKRG